MTISWDISSRLCAHRPDSVLPLAPHELILISRIMRRGLVVVASALALAGCLNGTPAATRTVPRTTAPAHTQATSTALLTTTPSMRVHVINVGQGAATLFEFQCGAVLVDTGGESNA